MTPRIALILAFRRPVSIKTAVCYYQEKNASIFQSRARHWFSCAKFKVMCQAFCTGWTETLCHSWHSKLAELHIIYPLLGLSPGKLRCSCLFQWHKQLIKAAQTQSLPVPQRSRKMTQSSIAMTGGRFFQVGKMNTYLHSKITNDCPSPSPASVTKELNTKAWD